MSQDAPAFAPGEGGAPDLDAQLAELERDRSIAVEARLDRARELARATPLSGVHHWRATLVVADMLHRVGDIPGAAQLAGKVHEWAERTGQGWLLARSHLVLSSVFDGIGDSAGALDHAVRAVDLLDDAAPARTRAVHLLRLADALATTGSTTPARERYLEVEDICLAIADDDMLVTAVNNLTMLECEAGDTEAAVRTAERLGRLAGTEHLNADVADTIARAYLMAARYPDAVAMLTRGWGLLTSLGASQPLTPAELALTHAEVLLATGQPDQAAERVQVCLDVCAERGLEGIRIRALDVQAKTHAARGDFESAYRTYRLHVEEADRLRCHQREAAARTRQALFETAEARREARRFRELARTDPLTGLFNRRLVDEQLPRILERRARGGDTETTCCVVAIVDVDHFKQVNDTYSHDVGDEVLRMLAGPLTDVAGRLRQETPPVDAADQDPTQPPVPTGEQAGVIESGRFEGLAARLGGEEFLLLLEDSSPGRAFGRLEALREAIERHPWHRLVAGLQVTVSIGATVIVPEDTKRTALARADELLYEAKSTGRNRVCADQVIAPSGVG
ncbi:MAG: GGDEF domain-containing protein [Kineosporiaceae bacterium]|nr:GGDEF domain-containing protein [Kineosporiaceae bacterium]